MAEADDTGAEDAALEPKTAEAVEEGGEEASDSREEGKGPRLGRPRLAAAELERQPGSRARIRIVLELGDAAHVAERAGVGEEALVLRLAALATLEALEATAGPEARFELVGIKRIHAFDESVILSCVRSPGDPSQRLLGCVPAGPNAVRGAAQSILNATNRIVEWLPGKPE